MKRLPITHLLSLAFIVCVIAPAKTWGQGGKGAKTEHGVAITISPVHLILPVVEITAEFQGTSAIGVAAIGGVGSVLGINVWELGAQMNYYLFGDFEGGMQLGGELLYAHASQDTSSSGTNISASSNGLGIGPYIGYKTTASFGLTFFAQLGYSFLIATAHASDNQGNSAAASASGGIPLLNLNLGWSF